MSELTFADVQKAAKAGARAAIAEEVKADDSNGGKGLLYALVEQLVNEALTKAFGAGGAFYKGDGVYQRFAETTFEQVVKALDEGLPVEEA